MGLDSAKKILTIQNLPEEEHAEKLDIQDLNDDILITIFRYLSIKDKILLERTCLRWKELLSLSWTRFKKLDLCESKWGMQPLHKVDKDLVSIDLKHAIILKSVISKCGAYLVSLDLGKEKLSPCGRSVSSEVCRQSCILRIVTTSCTKLQNIKIRVCCTDGLKSLTEHCNKLKSIKFFGIGYFYEKTIDELLNSLIKNNRELKCMKLIKFPSLHFLGNTENKFVNLKLSLDSTHVNDSENILANCIERSQGNLKEFKLEAFNLDFNGILNTLQFCFHLTKLKIHAQLLVKNYSDNQFANIFKHCRCIESISVKGLYGDSNTYHNDIFLDCETVHWLHYVNAVNLKKLYLEDNLIPSRSIFIDELPVFVNLRNLSFNNIRSNQGKQFCDSVSLCTSLEKLQFSRCASLMRTSQGHYFFKYLTNLRQLTLVQYNDCELNENEMVNCIARNLNLLEDLTLGLLNLSDDGLEYLPNLKHLRFLAILGNNKLAGKNLFLLKNLACLKCQDCYKLSDESLKLFIKNSVNLNKLIIEGCIKITHKFIKAAIAVKSSAKSNHKILTIEGNMYDWAINDFDQEYCGLRLQVSHYDDSIYELERY